MHTDNNLYPYVWPDACLIDEKEKYAKMELNSIEISQPPLVTYHFYEFFVVFYCPDPEFL